MDGIPNGFWDKIVDVPVVLDSYNLSYIQRSITIVLHTSGTDRAYCRRMYTDLLLSLTHSGNFLKQSSRVGWKLVPAPKKPPRRSQRSLNGRRSHYCRSDMSIVGEGWTIVSMLLLDVPGRRKPRLLSNMRNRRPGHLVSSPFSQYANSDSKGHFGADLYANRHFTKLTNLAHSFFTLSTVRT